MWLERHVQAISSGLLSQGFENEPLLPENGDARDSICFFCLNQLLDVPPPSCSSAFAPHRRYGWAHSACDPALAEPSKASSCSAETEVIFAEESHSPRMLRAVLALQKSSTERRWSCRDGAETCHPPCTATAPSPLPLYSDAQTLKTEDCRTTFR